MNYQEIPKLPRDRLEPLLRSADARVVADALLSAALHDPELAWVQTECLRHLDHADLGVRASAVIGLGHLARLHRRLDLGVVLPRLEHLQGDPQLGGRVNDVMDDIQMFVKKR